MPMVLELNVLKWRYRFAQELNANSLIHVIWPLSPFISLCLLISSKIFISNSLRSTV